MEALDDVLAALKDSFQDVLGSTARFRFDGEYMRAVELMFLVRNVLELSDIQLFQVTRGEGRVDEERVEEEEGSGRRNENKLKGLIPLV
jgi:hypothetical protein